MAGKRKADNESWKCDLCHKEKDALYFDNGKEICEECRKELRKNGYTCRN
jgi:hypothetical protein